MASVILKLEGVVGAALEDIVSEMERIALRLGIPTQCMINKVEATFVPNQPRHSQQRLLRAIRAAMVDEPTTLCMAGSDNSYLVMGQGNRMIKHKKGDNSDVVWDT